MRAGASRGLGPGESEAKEGVEPGERWGKGRAGARGGLGLAGPRKDWG